MKRPCYWNWKLKQDEVINAPEGSWKRFPKCPVHGTDHILDYGLTLDADKNEMYYKGRCCGEIEVRRPPRFRGKFKRQRAMEYARRLRED